MKKEIIKEILILLLVSGIILVHEYMKEGYWFKVSDIYKFPTHESIILLLIIAYLIYRCLTWLINRFSSSQA